MIPAPYLTGAQVVPERLTAQSAYPFSPPFVRDRPSIRFTGDVLCWRERHG